MNSFLICVIEDQKTDRGPVVVAVQKKNRVVKIFSFENPKKQSLYKPYFFLSINNVFLYNKSANITFNHGFSVERIKRWNLAREIRELFKNMADGHGFINSAFPSTGLFHRESSRLRKEGPGRVGACTPRGVEAASCVCEHRLGPRTNGRCLLRTRWSRAG